MKRVVALLAILMLVFPTQVNGSSTTITFYSSYGEDTQRTTYIYDLRNTRAGLYSFPAWESACYKSGALNWDNCISAIRLTLSSTRCAVLYDGYGYTGATYAVHGPRNSQYFNLSSVFNNRASSMRFGTIRSGVCTSPWS